MVGAWGAARLVGINVHSALPKPSFWGVLGSSPMRIPVPSTAVMFFRVGLVMPKRSLTILPFASLTWRVTERLVRLVELPLSISRLPRKAERVITASWSMLMRTWAQTPPLLSPSKKLIKVCNSAAIPSSILLNPAAEVASRACDAFPPASLRASTVIKSVLSPSGTSEILNIPACQ